MTTNNFQYTMELIAREAENLYKLTRDIQIGLPSWCLAVGESIRKLNTYRQVQAAPGNETQIPLMPLGREEKRYRGIYEKFKVMRTDGRDAPGEKHDGCAYFVLDVTHDPFALPAMRAYADACEAEYPRLARDLRLLTSPLLVKNDPSTEIKIPVVSGGKKEDWPEVGMYACTTCQTLRAVIAPRVGSKLAHIISAYCFACNRASEFHGVAIDFDAKQFLLVVS